jgi:hypothetical protein
MHPLPSGAQATPETFALMGVPDLAYVRRAGPEEEPGYAICTASGEVLAIAETREAAFGIVRQNDMKPVDAH